MSKNYDALDIAILRELRENSKQSYRRLAEKIGTHPNTLMQRIKKLENEKIIKKYVAEVNYKKLGYDFHAIIMLRTKKIRIGEPDQFINVSRLPEIIALYGTTGHYDAIALARVKGRDELMELLGKIQNIEGVLKTTTFVVLFSYKEPSEYNPFVSEKL